MRWLRTSWDAIWLWVDWHGRITTVVVIIVALGGAALVNRAASVWGEVHGFYLYVISGLAFAIFLATIAILGRRIEAQEKARRSVRLEQSEDAETKPVLSPQGTVQDTEPTLLSLMDTSFPRLGKIGRTYTFQFEDGNKIEVTAALHWDLTITATFLAFYVPSFLNTVDVCRILAEKSREIAQDLTKTGLSITVKAPGENPRSVESYVFTGKVYLYHQDHLNHQQLGNIEAAFHAVKLDVVLRGPDFLTQAWIAWKGREAKRETTLPNSLKVSRTDNALAPRIDIAISMVVPKGKLGERGIVLFVWATLTLREPREVEIDNFELEAIRDGIVRSAGAIDDVAQWGRVTHNDRDGFKGFAMQPLGRELTQRGNPVLGWLHFRFDLVESQIYKSILRLKVNTRSGSCTQDIQGGLAFPDPKNKGSIRGIDSGFLRGLGLGR